MMAAFCAGPSMKAVGYRLVLAGVLIRGGLIQPGLPVPGNQSIRRGFIPKGVCAVGQWYQPDGFAAVDGASAVSYSSLMV